MAKCFVEDLVMLRIDYVNALLYRQVFSSINSSGWRTLLPVLSFSWGSVCGAWLSGWSKLVPRPTFSGASKSNLTRSSLSTWHNRWTWENFSRKRLAYLFTVNLFHAKMVGRTSFGRLWTKYDKHLEWCQPRIVDAERFSQDCFKNIAAFNKVAEQPTANPFLSFLAFSQFLELFNVFIRIDKCILFL